MGRLKIVRAEYAGACYGVQRALDLTLETAESGKAVCTLGPLIHNPQVVSELESQGIRVAQGVDDCKDEAVVIRSHGVVPEVIDVLNERGNEVVDATCPHVQRAQRAAARLARDGYHVLVVGEAGHPEVEGILAHASREGEHCTVVGSVEDIPDELTEPVGIVVQTTQSHQKLDQIVEALQARGIEPMVKDTICFATVQRQDAARDLASSVDVMLVIGGRNSSNTTRLYEMCQQCGNAVYHVESAREIDRAWFDEVSSVGISAGASTPEKQIQEVVSYLETL
ncbi:4-hydroxy-3-methylbut-2-enyl diphosphate reductase [Anaerotardibacter muris]|uniref:4-hydroxy-3-methylbut-2-enyl diphosphate reductase n=1 Tax=Anaerotardibacter muris TaxID=2941505 RepID=UPI0020400B79|nr:4-hydroxy-3-methylbut-2-enyl diphosphate reductase [Anaerotardibacter muris]